MAKQSKSTPPYLPKGMEVNVPLHDVMRILKMIADRGQAGAFKSAAKKKGVLMIAPAETVNFAKDFLVKKKLDNNAIGKHIVNAAVILYVAGVVPKWQ
jgi:hypothetical protein